MKKFFIPLFAIGFMACNSPVVQQNSNEKADQIVVVQLESKSGTQVNGTVTFTQKANIVTMNLKANNLAEGLHAVHIHQKADCSSADGSSAGGHWNPTGAPHGKWGSKEGYHRGDIGNITANEKGEATLTFQTDEWCIGCDDETKNIVGHAIIIHQQADDFQTQPTGNAGGRVSCGGIISL